MSDERLSWILARFVLTDEVSNEFSLFFLLKEQEAVYELLLDLQAELLLKLKDGAVARDVYNHAVAYIKERKPELESHFVKNIGFAVSH